MIFELAAHASTMRTERLAGVVGLGKNDHLTHAGHCQHQHSRVPMHHLNAWCSITMMVANPAPLMMSAKTYCSSLIEAFIPVSLPLIIARERRQPSPALPDRARPYRGGYAN